MTTPKLAAFLSSCALGLLLTAAAQTASPPLNDLAGSKTTPVAAAPAEQPAPAVKPADADQTQAAPAKEPATVAPASAADQAAPEIPAANDATAAKPAVTAARPTNGNELRINFRNAPLESVLSYLSDAAGFIIFPKTELKGKVTVWSNQPVTKEEALEQLYSALDQNGYTAVRNGRTLTIYNKEDAKKQDLPVKSGSNPLEIPRNDEMVTQIIPVRFIDAVQVSRDLQPLLPDKAQMTANQGGNAILLTDTQISIHRMAEIIKALDTAVSSVSSIKVFQLRYADAKAVSSVIKDLFAPQDTSRNTTGAAGGGAGRFFNQLRGGGAGFGGRGAGGGAGGDAGSGGGRAPTPKVVAVSEDRSNSVIVSAPDDQMPIITDMINQVDTIVEDITELKVFHLHFADAQETAGLLANLFSDSNSSSSSGQGFRGQLMFGGRMGGAFGGLGGGRGTGAGTTGASARLQKQTKVVAVADLRTGSIVVSAARDLMKEIAKMIDDLDADPAKKQQVYVYDVQNTDPNQVLNILQSLFPAPSGSSSSRYNSSQQNGAGMQLNSRATQLQNQGYNRVSSGSSGLGGSRSSGR